MERKRAADFSVRASRDGHEFHEAWTARKALQLVFPTDNFVGLAIENLAPEDQQDASDASAEIADLVLYYGSGTSFAVADSVVVLQFKYSVSKELVPFGLADAKKTLEKFAAAYKDHKKRYGKAKTEAKLRFELVTNRPVSTSLTTAIKGLAVTTRPGRLRTFRDKIKSATELHDKEIAEFFQKVTVTGSTGSLSSNKGALSRIIVDWSRGRDAPALARLGALRELVRIKAGTAGSARNVIRRTDVFLALGVQGEDELLPAPWT